MIKVPAKLFAQDLGFVLKTNYCSGLQKKGYVKFSNFKKQNKIKYLQYVLPQKVFQREQN